jgi:GT2 family glycosyltransferase
VLSICVIHYRTPELLRECLSRLSRYAAGATVIVIDNASPEPVAPWLLAFPQVRLVHGRNHSLADAVNLGLAQTATPVVAQMNADVLIEAETFPVLLKALSPAAVGMVGPRCFTPDGRLQHQGPLYLWHHVRLTRQGGSVSVPWLSGAVQVIKREALDKVGGMNPSFRFYNEDMEWCWRFRQAGYQCRLVDTPVVHVGGSSTPADPAFLIEGYRGGYLLSQLTRPAWFQAAHRLAVTVEAALRRCLSPSPSRREAYRAIARMFRYRQFDQSPFGDSLSQRNPHFLPPPG